jgi:hypothetical protein
VTKDDEQRAAEERRREARYRMGVAGSTVPDGVENQMPMRLLGFIVKIGLLGVLAMEGVLGVIRSGSWGYWLLAVVSGVMFVVVFVRNRPLKGLLETAPD